MERGQFYKSKLFHGTIIGILLVLGALLIFKAGIEVGRHKAQFMLASGANYSRVFDDPRREGFLGDFIHDDVRGGHGAVGKIVRTSLPTIVIADKNNTEKSISIDDDTEIRKFTEVIKPEDLAVNDMVVVLGTPNADGTIRAKLIRLLPPPPMQNIDQSQPTL